MTILKKLLNSLCFTGILEPQGPEPFVQLLGLRDLGGPFSVVKHNDFYNSPEASTEALRRGVGAKGSAEPPGPAGERKERGGVRKVRKVRLGFK